MSGDPGLVVPCHWDPADSAAFRWYRSGSRQVGGVTENPRVGGDDGGGGDDETPLEVSSVQDSVLLMKFFALSSAVASALCWCRDSSTLELLFKLNAEETRIVEYGRWRSYHVARQCSE